MCASMTGGQRQRLTLTYIMPYLWLLSIRGCNYADVAAVVLATGTNAAVASWIDRTKTRQQ